ncbi:MAG: PQQ-binding-like beta-propeller repeat protein [Nitrosomonadales bacterium]
MLRNIFIFLVVVITSACIGPVKELERQIDDVYLKSDFDEPPAQLPENFQNKIPLQTEWSKSLGELSEYATFAFDESNVFVINNDAVLYKIDSQSGSTQSFQLKHGLKSGPSILLDRLYYIDRDNYLNAVSVNGQVLWRVFISEIVQLRPYIFNNKVLVKLKSNKILAFNPESGNLEWRYEPINPPLTLSHQSEIIFANNVIFSGSAGGKVELIDIDSGAFLYQINLSKSKGVTDIERTNDMSGSLVLKDDILYGATYKGDIGAFEVRSGKKVWDRKISSIHGVFSDSLNIILLHENDSIYAFDPMSGKTLWKSEVALNRKLSKLAVSDACVFSIDGFGFLLCIDPENGLLKSQLNLSGDVNFYNGVNQSEIKKMDDHLYVMFKNGQFIKIKSK